MKSWCRFRRAGIQRYVTGISHLMGSNPIPIMIKSPTTNVVELLMAEDEGFEPPQTESESGVLPLHKSSMNVPYYTHFS